MSFSLIGPFSFGSKVTSAQFNQLDSDHANALDKSAAGDAIAGEITFSGTGHVNANVAQAIISTTTGGIEGNDVAAIRPIVARGIDSSVPGGLTAGVPGGITSLVNGGIVLGGGPDDWITFGTPRNRTQSFGVSGVALVGAWTSFAGIIIGGATLDVIAIPLDFHDGATITQVTMSFAIENPHASLPNNQPKFAVIRRNVATRAIDGFLSTGSTQLASATTAGYYNSGDVQGLTLTPDQNNTIDKATYAYYATIIDENGANSIAANEYYGFKVIASDIADLRFQ